MRAARHFVAAFGRVEDFVRKIAAEQKRLASAFGRRRIQAVIVASKFMNRGL